VVTPAGIRRFATIGRRDLDRLNPRIRSNSSHGPIAMRLAISAERPRLGRHVVAVGHARRLMLPSVLCSSWNVSQVPMAVRLAISADAPADSAVT